MRAIAQVALIERNNDNSMTLAAGIGVPNFSPSGRIRCRCQNQSPQPLWKDPLPTLVHLPRLWDPTAQNTAQSPLPIVCGSPNAEFWPQLNLRLPLSSPSHHGPPSLAGTCKFPPKQLSTTSLFPSFVMHSYRFSDSFTIADNTTDNQGDIMSSVIED